MRLRMRSVKNISQVTRALEAVSASRVRKAQQAVLATRAYAGKALQVLRHLGTQPGSAASLHPLLQPRETINKHHGRAHHQRPRPVRRLQHQHGPGRDGFRARPDRAGALCGGRQEGPRPACCAGGKCWRPNSSTCPAIPASPTFLPSANWRWRSICQGAPTRSTWATPNLSIPCARSRAYACCCRSRPSRRRAHAAAGRRAPPGPGRGLYL